MIQLIVVPYDSGRRAYRMGRGPEHLLESGLVARLEQVGVPTAFEIIETQGDALDAAFDSAAKVASATRAARADGALPVILAGNCITSLGAFAGLDSQPAMLWMDAHADFNTPATSPSGFLDGMALAVITGRCHVAQSKAVPGFCALPDSELTMLGTRSIDADEAPILEHIPVVHNAAELRPALLRLQRDQLYLHVDLDVLDPASLRANQFAAPNGLPTASLLECIDLAARLKRIVAIAITAYDPDADATGSGPDIVFEILRRASLRPA